MLTSTLLLMGSSLLVAAVAIQGLAIWVSARQVNRRNRLARRLLALASPETQGRTRTLSKPAAVLTALGRALRSPDGRRWATNVTNQLKTSSPTVGGLTASAVAVLDTELARDDRARSQRRNARVLGALEVLKTAPHASHLPSLVSAIFDPVREVSATAALTVAAAPPEYGGAMVPLATKVREAEPEIQPALLWGLEALLVDEPGLISSFGQDPEPPVRRAALAAAGRVLANQPAEPMRQQIGDFLVAAVDDVDDDVATHALETAPAYDERELLRACGAVAISHRSKLRFAACRALARFTSPQALPLLAEAISGLLESEAHRICTELEERDSGLPNKVRKALLEITRDRLPWAIRILAAVEGEDAAEEVRTALENEDPKVRAAAAQAAATILLRTQHQQTAGPMLETLLTRWAHESEPVVIVPLADALADSGTTEASQALLRRFTDFPDSVQDRIVETLARAEQNLTTSPPAVSPERRA